MGSVEEINDNIMSPPQLKHRTYPKDVSSFFDVFKGPMVVVHYNNGDKFENILGIERIRDLNDKLICSWGGDCADSLNKCLNTECKLNKKEEDFHFNRIYNGLRIFVMENTLSKELITDVFYLNNDYYINSNIF